jgi:hypothetical protein
MARTTETERETLRISAETAAKMIAELQGKRAAIDYKISMLKPIVDGYKALSGRRPKNLDAAQDAKQTANGKKRAPKGMVTTHIEQILADGRECDEPALRKAIEERFGVAYGRATVYTCLRRGLDTHKFIRNGTKWSLNAMRAAQQNT